MFDAVIGAILIFAVMYLATLWGVVRTV